MFGFRRKPAAPPVAATSGAEWRARGNAALGQGDLAEAANCYRQAAADPADAMARVNLGYVLLEQGQVEEAGRTLHEATQRAGADRDVLADASFLLARAQQAQGQQAAALASLRAALAARPGFDEALQQLVPALLAAGREADALAVAEEGARIAASPTRFMLLAQALHGNGRPDESLQVLDAVLAAQAGHPGALEARGNLLLELDRPAEALVAFEQAAATQSGQPEAQSNLAAALLKLDRAAEALARADAALELQPEHRAALHNKSQALLNLLRVEEARDVAQHALRLYPDDADLRWNLGVAHLLLGELEDGFAAHEARWQAAGFGSRSVAAIEAKPRWDGSQGMNGKAILLYAEQGLGDSIQFLRYLQRVASQAAQVLLQVPQALLPLLRELPANCRVLAAGAPLPAFDLQCPLLSLPHALRTTLADIPAAIPYLHADAAKVQAWRDRLPNDGRRKVGIAWSGNAAHSNDRNRSIPLERFRELDAADCCFVSLQPQVRESDRAALAGWTDLIDAGPQLQDFAETAALMEALDLVVTVDTSVAHLAGALGRPVWILLPYSPDWRWMVGRSDTPWYPTARLFRQPAAGDWASVLARVRATIGA